MVLWNVVLFGVMGATSALQTLLCGFNILNSMLGLLLGKGFCQNKVSGLLGLQGPETPAVQEAELLCVFQVHPQSA